MSLGRRVMIGIGAVVIVGMMLIAAFSLGVYVGEHGWTWRGVSLAGPQRLAAPPGGPGGAPPGALPGLGQPDALGAVRRVDGEILGLATRDGPRIVEVGEATQVRRIQGEPADIGALRPGTLVAVFGHPGDGGRVLVADLIVILPSRPPQGGAPPPP